MQLHQFLLLPLIVGTIAAKTAKAQETYPVNHVQDKRHTTYAVTNATIHINPTEVIKDGVLVFQDGIIQTVDTNSSIPDHAIVIDAAGQHIYPAFIDLHTDFGVSTRKKKESLSRRNKRPQYISNKKGPYGWNEAIQSERNAYQQLTYQKKKATAYRSQGIGTVLSHVQDGIARGTGALLALSDERENLSLLKASASAHFSFDKGISTQDYPSSLMGSIALLRQTFLDAAWYKTAKPAQEEGINMTLKVWEQNMSLPLIFDANDKWNSLRADKIAKEYGVTFIIKGGGDEYQRINDIRNTKAVFIIPVNYPQKYDVSDPQDNRFLSLKQLKNWEMAPLNAMLLAKEKIPFCFTSDGLKKIGNFLPNVRQAVQKGLSEQDALKALTTNPARFINASDKIGTLEVGKIASFFIADSPIFQKNAKVKVVYVKGKKQSSNAKESEIGTTYQIKLTRPNNSSEEASLQFVDYKNIHWIAKEDTFKTKYHHDNKQLTFNIVKEVTKGKKHTQSFSGRMMHHKQTIIGTGYSSKYGDFEWSGTKENKVPQKTKTLKQEKNKELQNKDILYPFMAYGNKELPKQEKILIKNATLWTNTDRGIIEKGDILMNKGKIVRIASSISDGNAKVIDASGKHVTPGIVDEHSHIAVTGGVNEYTQSSSAEVRIQDALNPEDIGIYRQLSGGVTTSHILHGSSNPIGGQTQLIKLRWGKNADELLFKGWDPFIKFALGENVKQSNWGANYVSRFPQTRMGVQQIIDDAFLRALEYIENKKTKPETTRTDLELEALAEILQKKRFITCHSYVQSEINMLMKIAEKYSFNINTFTHILEGYKVADKMKKHSASASTFSDWWTYKMEVMQAIPYNAALLHKMGVNVAINSDDREMARRLNQEAAKIIRYGKINEEDALKTVTLNPAKMLHIDDRVGSLAEGKDADVVIWSDHPLSVYAKAEKTIVDGTIYFDQSQQDEKHKAHQLERQRIIQKIRSKTNKEGKKPQLQKDESMHCETMLQYAYDMPSY